MLHSLRILFFCPFIFLSTIFPSAPLIRIIIVVRRKGYKDSHGSAFARLMPQRYNRVPESSTLG